MDKDEVPFIFERFYRADQSEASRGRTGLGLSIAKWIIDEHKGSVEVVTRRGKAAPLSSGARRLCSSAGIGYNRLDTLRMTTESR